MKNNGQETHYICTEYYKIVRKYISYLLQIILYFLKFFSTKYYFGHNFSNRFFNVSEIKNC